MSLPVKKGTSGGSNIPTGVREVKMLPLKIEGINESKPYVLISVLTGNSFDIIKTARLHFPSEENFESWKGKQFLSQFCFALCGDWIDRDLIKPKDIKESDYSYKELLKLIIESIDSINSVISHNGVKDKKYFAIFVANEYEKDGKLVKTSRLFIPSYKDSTKKGGCFEFPYYFPIIHYKPQDTLLDKEGKKILCETFDKNYLYSDNSNVPHMEAHEEEFDPSTLESEEVDPFKL